MQIAATRGRELPRVGIADLAEENLKVGCVVTLDGQLGQICTRRKLSTRDTTIGKWLTFNFIWVLPLTRHIFTLRDFNARQMTRAQLSGGDFSARKGWNDFK